MRAGIYVHIPFCPGKCRYCSFNSVPYDDQAAKLYVDALVREIETCPVDVEPSIIYIGGGTPTTLPADGLASVIGAINGRFGLWNEPTGHKSGDIVPPEFTIEANPGTVSGLDVKALTALGVNRVSLGAQSFSPSELAMLGRLHGPADVAHAAGTLRRGGITNISLDLIYSLPGQDMRSWKESLAQTVDLNPEHISMYDLTLEEGTPLYSEVRAGRLVMPPEPVQVEMYLCAVDFLETAGYRRYEISNFARPGFACRHNINYWDCGEYLGFGAGAHSYAGGRRTKNIDGITYYTAAAGAGGPSLAESEELSPGDMEREFIMLGLRKAAGLEFAEFRRRFGHDLAESRREAIARLEGAGLVETSGGRLRLTMSGVLVSNAVIRELF
ncbi:MAG: radical SAM family heme chaperone HemW [Nitrospirae bacterium]|nr:radical SAM family heme chaperone HemW [Nitrospirota bacterium]MBI5694817.1 radical SAM family heme chaperone HemW [Nitrospirota bacterium]